ncbi:unnamed protein product, partial [Polarella glacialis]
NLRVVWSFWHPGSAIHWSPRRSFLTWVGDMSKQMVGAGWGHCMNIATAVVFGVELESSAANNQCVWYLVGFLCDISFVTFLCWAVNAAIRNLADHHELCEADCVGRSVFRTGRSLLLPSLHFPHAGALWPPSCAAFGVCSRDSSSWRRLSVRGA